MCSILNGLGGGINFIMFSSSFVHCLFAHARLIFAFVLVSVGITFAQPAHAQASTVQELSFGEFISTRNDAQYDITVNLDGSYGFSSGAFYEISPPSVGIYEFTGLAANATVTTVTVTQTAPLISSGATSFQLINLQSSTPSTTSALGVLQVRVAGTARTSGNGLLYPDRTYSGGINIDLTLEVN